jgi:RNA polymerase sigma-70 factor (ECF subfamily)
LNPIPDPRRIGIAMDDTVEPASIDETLREVARTRRIAAALLRGADAAEIDDVLQDASVAALASAVTRGEAFAHWIRGAVRHLSVTVLRRRERRSIREREAARPVALPAADELAQRFALHRALLAAIEALSEPLRVAIVRRYFDDAKPREIAREQGVPVATVKTRLRRGLALLRVALRGEWGEGHESALVVLSSGGAGVAVAGAVVMAAKWKAMLTAAAAIAVVGIATVVVQQRAARQDAGDGARVNAASARGAHDDGGATRSAELAAARAPDPAIATAPTPGSRRARLGERRVGSIVGVVVDAKGVAVAGAEVAVVRPSYVQTAHFESAEPRVDERHTSRSESDGSFRFDDLVRGVEYELLARAADGCRGVVHRARAGSGRTIVIALAPTMTLEGIVVDARDERPVEGARVQVDGAESSDGLREFDRVTDAQGRFAVAGIGDGLVLLMAFAPDGRLSGGRCTNGFVPGGKSEIRIPVGGNAEVRGRVVDADTGEPIAGAALRLEFPSTIVVARTAADGAFRVRPHQAGKQADSVRLGVVAAGYAQAEVRVAGSIDPDASLPPVEIKLRREATAVGRIVLRDGSPLADAVVFAFVEDATASHPDRAATTDADGAFRIFGLDRSFRHALQIRHDECEELSIPFPSDELASNEIDFGTVSVGRGAILAGRVVDASDAPIPEAYVKIFGTYRFFPDRVCDANGCFEFAGVPAGHVRLVGHAKEQMSEAVAVLEVAEEAIVDDVVLKTSAGSTVAGRIVDSSGTPVKGATLYFVRGDSKIGLGGRVWGFATSDEDGRFRIAGVDAEATGSFTLMPSWNRVAVVPLPEFAAVRAGTTGLQIVEPDGKPVTGRVADDHGDPIEGALVRLIDADGAQVTLTRSGRDGGFSILVPVHVELRCEARVVDPARPGAPLDRAPVAAFADHVYGGDPPLTIVVRGN